MDLRPLLFKRLRIQGSTLRSRSDEYQADLIARCVVACSFGQSFTPRSPRGLTVQLRRFQEHVLDEITGCSGTGKIRISMHAVYPWEKIQEAHRTMESDSNA